MYHQTLTYIKSRVVTLGAQGRLLVVVVAVSVDVADS